MARASFPVLAGLGALLASASARADQPIAQQDTWTGHVSFFATGASLAADGPDGDTNLDMLDQPASVDVAVPDVPALGEVRGAYLYWGGSIGDSECMNPMEIDDTVDLTVPGGIPTAVSADACFCSTAGALSYDVQACRTDITALIGTLTGTYTVDGFSALVNNLSTNNASFSLVLVYAEASLPPRRVALYDGLLTMSSSTNPESIITLAGLDIDDPPESDLTWYVLEGDVGGSAGESAEVTGLPGGGMIVLSDPLNPPDNPMNHTINTTMPPQPDAVGVDIDRFPLDAALVPTDTSVEVRLTAGLDKWWLVYDVVGVNVFEPVLADTSSKDWTHSDDPDGDGVPSPGDTIRYTIHLDNSGNADATVTLDDPIPPEAASWTLVDAAGGTDLSVGDTLTIADLVLGVGGSVDVVFDVVLADVPDGTMMFNTAEYDAQPGGVHGFVVAPPVVVTNAGAGTSSGTDGGGSTSTGPGTTSSASTSSDTGAGGSTGSGGGGSGGDSSGGPAPTSSGGTTSGGAAATTGTPTTDAAPGDDGGCGCHADPSRRRSALLFGGCLVFVLIRTRKSVRR